MQLMEINSWSDFKTLVSSKLLLMQYTELGSKYDIYASECHFMWHCSINKTATPSSDQTDFQNNYKSNCNKSIGEKMSPFASALVRFAGEGVCGEAVKDSITNFDLKITDSNKFCSGGIFYTEDSVFGDYAEAQIVDVDNILGYGAGFVVETWIKKWYIIPNNTMKIKTNYAGNIYQNLYLRLKYTSIGAVDNVKVLINYLLSNAV